MHGKPNPYHYENLDYMFPSSPSLATSMGIQTADLQEVRSLKSVFLFL